MLRARSLVAAALLAAPASAQGESCERACLEGLADQVYAALAAHDPARLPLTADVRYTENGRDVALGEGFWQTAGPILYRMAIVDPVQQTAAVEAVVTEGDGPVMHMLRIAVQDRAMSEIETIIVRDGDSDPIWAPENLAGTEPGLNSLLLIRPSEQETRHGLIAAAEAYWRAFETNGAPDYVRAPFLPTTRRTENGVTTTTSTGVAGIAPQTAAQGFDEGRYPNRRISDRRYPVVDVERGIVLSIVRFGHQPGKVTPNIPVGDSPLVAEFFHVQAGRIVEIHVVMNFDLRETDPTGW